MLDNEKRKSNMEKNVNLTLIGIVEPMENGIQIAAKNKAPNPTNSGIDEANMRESTLKWVHRSFGTRKEDI